MKKLKRLTALAAAFLISVGVVSGYPKADINATAYNTEKNVAEYFDSSTNFTEESVITLKDAGESIQLQAAATPLSKKFDLGANAQSGYTSVKASDVYTSSKGYGFSSASNVSNVAASGSGALSDAVQFTGSTTFNADLPKGLYQVKVILGNTSRTSVYMENMLQIVNMTGNNAVDEILIPVTDGQLNVRAAAGKSGYAYTISAIEINKVSDDPTLPNTVWFCGDSTVCNYYPKSSSTQAGWGQVIDKYIDTATWNVRNMAASGQYAKGFMDAGQFDAIEYYGKKGDVYIISIGINDTNYSNSTEYYQTVTDMVKRAKAKGMEVILVKQEGRKGDYTKNPLLKSRWFAAELDKIGKEQNVKVVDLFNLFQDYCVSIGATAADALFIDNLHPNRNGALKLAELFAKQIDWKSIASSTPITPPQPSSDIQDGKAYMLKNVNSGLYIDVYEEKAANGTNIHQWTGGERSSISWKAVSAGDGYFYLYSQLGDGNTYVLDVTARKADNGTNIELYTYNGGVGQQFKFVKNSDGSHTILTKASGDASCIEIVNAETGTGANVQQWELNGNNCQKWVLEPVDIQQSIVTTTVPQPVVTTTTALPVPPASGVVGDANSDGVCNLSDAVFVMQCLANPSVYNMSKQGLINADVYLTGDGVNAQDALKIQKVATGVDTFDIVTPPAQSVYYAADAKYVNGVTETVNEGYTGQSYINLDNSTDSSIAWTVNAPNTGNYLVTFRVANGTDTDRKMKIEVNSGSDYWVQPFTGTGSWTDWSDRGIVLPLNAGNNEIKLTSLTENGGPNFDYLKFEKTDEPIAETYVPEEKPTIPDSSNPVLYIAGDSTVQSYRESYAPQQGWGYYLGNYFNKNVTVSNHAIAGRSSKSFYDNGRLTTILDSMKKGDYLLVQFGINDSAYNNAERYAPVCGNVDNPTNGSFEFYIEKYIKGALDKECTPILVTTVIGLKSYSGGKFVGSYGNYCNAMKDMAKKYNIPCIDLNSLMVNHYNSIGYDAAYKYHMVSSGNGSTDMTHFTETGANAVANIVANAIKSLNIPVSQYVK